jgi:hypothetical protein
LPEAAIAQRLAAGRFRVKGNVDLDTARAFAADLERLGAVCSIVDAATGTVIDAPAASSPPVGLAAPGADHAGAAPSARPAADQSALAGAAPSTRPAADQSALAGAAPSTRPAAEQSALAGAAPRTAAASEDSTGLAAALGDPGRASQQDLGALAAEQGSLAVSSLDGADDPTPPSVDGAAFAPDEAAFAPPEADHAELALAVDLRRDDPEPADEFLTLAPEGEDLSMASSSSPSPSPAARTGAAGDRTSTSALTRARQTLADSARVRLVAGVLLVLALGFLPAHLVAGMREDSAYTEVRAEVRAAYAEVRTADEWAALDEYLAGQRDVMDSQRRNIAVTSLLVWALVAGGLGFVWFRVIDWDRVAPR